MIKSILDYENIENANKIETNLDDLMNEKYKENMKIRFCDLIGLNYNLHYKKYNKYIDSLYEKFNVLSRKFLPNYYETNVAENSGDITYLFDFSKFFQKYLITKKDNKNNILLGMKLLLNDTEYIEYEKIGMIKEKIQEFFYENIVDEENMDYSINNAMDFIEEYDELFNLISKETELSSIKFKQYIINANRNYLYGNENIYGEISYLYDTKKIDEKATNRIINALINTNKRNNYNKKDENKLGLQIYEDLLTYLVLSENYYYLVIEPYSNTEIEFAKAIINGQEVMMRHFSDENGNIMVSEKTEFDNLPDILNFDIKLKINGKEYKDKLI